MTEFIYGRRPVEEAERGRRVVRRVLRAPETPAGELERLCGSPDHQGVVAEVDPYPYGDPVGILRREGSLLVALDQVQDPRNLGAVCRSAEFAGVSGSSSPSGARRRSRPPPARRPRARSSTWRSPTSATSPTGSPRRRRRASGSGAPTRMATRPPGRPTSAARPCSSSAARARGSARGSRPPATACSPCRGGESSTRSTSPPPPLRSSSRRSASAPPAVAVSSTRFPVNCDRARRLSG